MNKPENAPRPPQEAPPPANPTSHPAATLRKPPPRLALAAVQSILVSGFVLVACFGIYGAHSRLAIGSLAASAFIAFGFPDAESARARYLMGGYACGVASGAACGLARMALLPGKLDDIPLCILFCGAAVLLTAFAMLALNLQHPPSCALAVGMVLEPEPITMGISILVCMAALCAVRFWVMKFYKTHWQMQDDQTAAQTTPEPPESAK